MTALFAVALPVTVAADGPGVVTGVVINGTSGSTVPAELPVTLTKYVAGIAVETFNTAADEIGKFGFEGLETDSQIVYQVRSSTRVRHLQVTPLHSPIPTSSSLT